MNVRMWEHKITKLNLNKLVNSNYKIIGPDIGEMVCGEYGSEKFSMFEISNKIIIILKV